MLQKALVLVFVLASIACSLGCGSTSSHYLYATVPVENQIIAYREDPNSGVVTEISGSPYSVGEGANSLALHPSGKYLYASNPGQGGTVEDDISLFDVNSDGTLTEVTPRTSLAPYASTPQLLLTDPAGAYLYVMNTGSSNISVFAIDSGSGALTQVPNSPFNIGAQPLGMQIAPSGNFLYVSVAEQTSGWVAAYSLTAGQLALVDFQPTDGVSPYSMVINSAGTYLYAANYVNNSISVFAISSSGTLSLQAGTPLADGYNGPISMIFDPSGNYLYVANQTSNNVSVYTINSDGLPAALTSSNSTNAYGTENTPSFLAIDPGGKYLFVASQGTGSGIQGFEISSGTLTAVTINAIGNTPSSIAILK
jgi:6-phosphogluconolactonase (cycloisomerase 2 family)